MKNEDLYITFGRSSRQAAHAATTVQKIFYAGHIGGKIVGGRLLLNGRNVDELARALNSYGPLVF